MRKETLNNLAVIYENDGQLEQALVLLKKALELDPNFELAQKNVERINEKKTLLKTLPKATKHFLQNKPINSVNRDKK